MFDFLFKKNKTALPPLHLRNTLSGELERFEPINNTVKIYGCGPTAYDRQHIGNFFPPVVANILHRTLLVWGYKVQEVNNITDFGHLSEDEKSEDKMTKGLRREGLTLTLANMRILAEKYAGLFFDDLPQLGVDPKRVRYPRASDYIEDQISIIKTLEQKGYAYRTSDGVYFDVSRFSGYGKLGGINLSGQQEGARVEANSEKRGPFDFALWKLDKKIGWQSPWGQGFPGWHTECVAMIFKLLGKQIDIHLGGIDLVPIHHNNEIAQVEAMTGRQFVRYWVHNAHITVEGKKVSKSLGNTIYLHSLADRGLSPRALRYWFLTGHYRTPMNFTWEAIEGANTAFMRLVRAYHEMPKGGVADQVFLNEFYAAIADDLNTPKALALIWENIKKLNRATLAEADKILGLGFTEAKPVQKLTIKQSDLPEGIQALLDAREAARKHKDFEKADEMRREIESAGYELLDTPEGPTVTKK